MSLTFIYGRAGSGKSEYIYNELSTLCKTGKKVYLVVPEQYTHIAEKNILKCIDAISPFSVEILSFERLCSRINNKFFGSNIKTIDSSAKNIIISRILKNNKLEFYKNTAQAGFVDLCSSFVGELKKYNIMPDDLKNEIDNTKNAVLKQKLEDMHLVYTKYEEATGELNIDSEDVLDILIHNIDKTHFFDDAYVFFDEFSSFIPKELEVISKIAVKASETYISLCTDELNDNASYSVFLPVVKTASKIKQYCNKYGIKINSSIYLDNKEKYSDAISHIEKNIYKSNKRIDANDGVSVYYDINPYYELINTAEEIVRLCRDFGYKYNEIAVVCSNINEYSKIVKHVFSEYNIPCFADKKTTVLEHSVIRHILGLIDIYLESYSYDSVFSFLNLGYTRLSSYQINILENYVLASNVQKSAWTDSEKWTYKLGKYSNKNEFSKLRETEINEARSLFINDITLLHNALKGRHSGKYMIEKLYEYLKITEFDKVIEKSIENFKSAGYDDKAKEYSVIWDIIVKTFDNIYEIIGDDLINVKEFREYLYIGFSQYKTGLIPTSSDEVSIGNIERSIHSNIKALFVLGMADSEFPAKINEESLFTNSERDELLKDGIELSDNTINKLYYNRFLTYKCLTTPSRRLYLSFSVSNLENKPLRPSFVLNTVCALFNDVKIKSRVNDIKEGIDKISLPQPTMSNLLDAYYSNELDKIWNDVALYFAEKGYDDNYKKYIDYTPQAFRLEDNVIDKIFDKDIYTSISKIQRYRECKFSYFLERMLKLEEKEVFSIAPTDIGSLVHKVFEEICKSMIKESISFKNVEKAYYKEKINIFVNEYIEKLKTVSKELSKRQIYLVKRLKNTMYLCFEVLIEHISNSEFEPLGYEMYFGGDDIGSVDIKTSAGKTFKIHGVIDRADIYKTENGSYVRIIDYKTGKKTFNFSDVFYGLDVQLMVYLNALVNSDKNYKYGGALYFKVDDCMFKGDNKYAETLTDDKIKNMLKLKGVIPSDDDIIDAYDPITKVRANTASYEQFTLLSNQIIKTITELCEDMVSGDITINPYKKGKKTPCDYCNYGGICKFDMGHSYYDNIVTLSKNEVFDMLEVSKNVDEESKSSD